MGWEDLRGVLMVQSWVRWNICAADAVLNWGALHFFMEKNSDLSAGN